jgi:hypothetical protein
MTRNISYDRAVALLSKEGHTLVKGFVGTKKGVEFFITGPGGGPVTNVVARQLIDHPNCCEIDDGLLPGVPQSYSLYWGSP